MKFILLILSAVILSGCGSYAQFTGRAPAQEYIMCSKSTGGGVMGAISGQTDIIKITTQGDITDSLAEGKITAECSDDGKSLTIAPAQ